MGLSEFDDYVSMVERARNAWLPRVDVRLGIESDYAPGMEPWLERLHDMAPFHHVLGSVHPHLHDYRDRYFDGDVAAFQRTYFEHLAMAAETGLFDTIAHPDLVKYTAPSEWDPERLMDIIGACLDRIAATGAAMELNTSGLAKPLGEMSPGRTMLMQMRRREIPVVIGADAHDPERVASQFEAALDALEAVGYHEVSLFLDRQRHEFAIATARQSLSALP
jgi:histidinol-phosphatase (PHP family)